MDVTLLGPQRRVTSARATVAELVPDGPVAAVNAGWRERESDTGELNEVLGGRLVNLELHRRWLQLVESDAALAEAEQRLTDRLDELRSAYRLRLEQALTGLRAVQQRVRDADLRAAATQDAVAAVQALDGWHLAQARAVRDAYVGEVRPDQHGALQEQRGQVAGLLAGSAGLVLAGGHVGVLLHVLRLFALAGQLGAPLIAWSAGAMVLAERVVLFHDHPVRGERAPEVHAEGLGLYRGVVPFPHAARRLRLDDRERMGLLARRLAPAQAVLLPDGSRLDLRDGAPLPAPAVVVSPAGRVLSGGEAA
jgi:hypothetical protein